MAAFCGNLRRCWPVAEDRLRAIGLLLRNRPVGRRAPLALPAYFCLVNIASLVATGKLVGGDRIDSWQTQRPTNDLADGEAAAPEPEPLREAETWSS